MRRRDSWVSRLVALAIVAVPAVGGLVLMGAVLAANPRNEAPLAAAFCTVGLLWGLLYLGPVGRSVGALLRSEEAEPGADGLDERLAWLEQRGLGSGEVEAILARLDGLEDRIDFTERLLARQDEPTPPEFEAAR